MPAVFVHGNPETPAVWEPLVSRLQRSDVELLRLPGFGCPRPAGFTATKDEYASWLIGELERIGANGEPIDLVGHDWGGGLTVRAVSLRPELVRSWVSDVLGLFTPNFEWHDFAKIWMTEGAGEQFFIDFLASPMADRVATFVAIGIKEPAASKILAAVDEEFAACVLALYRSATPEALAVWANDLTGATRARGLAIRATADPFTGGHGGAGVIAARAGAKVATLEGLGHWWMLEQPELAATLLEEFWAES
jgi:pimeloyl-ACP methyl ester carboxylesterase